MALKHPLKKCATDLSVTHFLILLSLYRDPGDHLHRTFFRTFSTACALVVIDHRHVIVHVDGIEGALLGAEGAADAACGADALDVLASLVAGAGYLVLLPLGDHDDQVLGTDLGAGLAAGTLALVYPGNAPLQMHGPELAGLDAGPVAHAAELAALVVCARHNGKGVAVL